MDSKISSKTNATASAPTDRSLIFNKKGNKRGEDAETGIVRNFPKPSVSLSKSTKLETYLKMYNSGSSLPCEIPCPVCLQDGNNIPSNSLRVFRYSKGSLGFTCSTCEFNAESRIKLITHFLGQSTNDPNVLLKALQLEIEDKYFCNKQTGVWYEAFYNTKILNEVPEDKIIEELWPKYLNLANHFRCPISERKLKDYLQTLTRFNSIAPVILRSQVALEDGSCLDLSTFRTQALSHYVDFHLPIRAEDIAKPPTSPTWDAMLNEHANDEDRNLLEIFLGYIFSGEEVCHQSCMLIFYGISDTGKSVLLRFLAKTIPNHSAIASINDCLTNPVLNAGLVGKRVLTSSEAVIKASEASRFRSLIAGEEMRIKRLYRDEKVVSHNSIFVSATNEVGWIEATPENKKRIRVVEWKNRIPKEKMDPFYIEKLLKEKVGIIVKCLRAYSNLKGNRIPDSKSTDRFMSKAGQNINSVASWIAEKEIHSGPIFNSTKDLHRIFKSDADDRTTFLEFSRKLAKVISEEHRTKRIQGDQERRGYNLNKQVREGL